MTRLRSPKRASFSQVNGPWPVRGGELGDQQRGEREEGFALRIEETGQFRSLGALWTPLYLSFVANACRKLGYIEEGLAAVTEALSVTEKNVHVSLAAELHRLKGELLLQSSVQSLGSRVKKSPKSKACPERSRRIQSPESANPKSQAEAETCFHKAIAIAKQQEAKSLELRAAMSLSQLWRYQGKKVEAHKLLSEVYNWFTEGFDTKDLQEAKALLDELAEVG